MEVISGTAETDKRLTTEELKTTIDFCANSLNPTFTQERWEVMNKLTNKVSKSSKMYSGGMMIESYNGEFEQGDPTSFTFQSNQLW